MKMPLYNKIYYMKIIDYKLLIKNSIIHIRLPFVYGSESPV
jgi:hypothetical protein